MSVPASGNVTLTGINSVFGKAVGFSLASYAGTIPCDVTTGAETSLALPITMRSSFLNKTPLGRVGKPTIAVAENATIAGGTLTNCVTISWSAPGGATPTGYTVEVSTDGSTFATLSNPTSTSITHTPISNVRYWYRVRATTATANGAWSSNSGAAVFPYQTITPQFIPPTTTTYITITGAAGGRGAGASDFYRSKSVRFSNMQVSASLPTYTMSFGGVGADRNAGAGFTSFTTGFLYFSGGAGGNGNNINAGGGGGASVIANPSGYLIIGGGGGNGDSGRIGGGNGGGNGGTGTLSSSDAGVAGADGSVNAVVGGTGAGRGGTAFGNGGSGGSGANANGAPGTETVTAIGIPFPGATTNTVGSGGAGTSDGNFAGGGGGGGWGGGGGGAAASNQPGWGGQFFAGGGGGGSSYSSNTGSLFNAASIVGSSVSYASSGWCYATW